MKIMKITTYVLFVLVLFTGCEKVEKTIYTGNELEYELFQINSSYDYSGKVHIRELATKDLELTITLEGAAENRNYEFPAHLHHGRLDQGVTHMFAMLNPVSIKTLKSVTVLNEEKIDYDKFQTFDGHIKVHLAAEGPDKEVILAAGWGQCGRIEFLKSPQNPEAFRCFAGVGFYQV